MRRLLTSAFHLKKWPSRIIQLVILFMLINLLFPLPAPKPWSPVVYARDGSILSAYLTSDEKWRVHTNLEEVSPELIQALLAKEDKYFYYHPGVNPVALGRALFLNVFTGRRQSGASTITMQVARLMEPRPRNYFSKGIEMIRSFQLEWKYSKKEILEMYLSYLPYGGNVEGVKAASMIYFDRLPEKLSLAQAVLLTVIPNRPNSLRLDRDQKEAQEMRDKWLYRFAEDGTFPQNQVEHALYEPIQARRHEVPIRAPHFCQMVRNRFSGNELHTTLDPEIQQTAERLLANYVNRVRPKGVSNGAILIIDNAHSEVVGYCGSADFYDDAAGGQCNGINAVRSPGSTLKPSLYGLAFDQGIITPKTVLHDSPFDYNGYAPENYDLKFRGEVTVEFALRNSLNIPPVRLLKDVGLANFITLLSDGGLRTVQKRSHDLGLSLVLGGCGVTLEELTRLFSSFAREGRMHSLNYLQEEAKAESEGVRLFSPESAWMIADILSGIERPDIPQDFLSAANKTRISWKTGTSYGKRDAWSVGFTPRYTIGVWMGNFDGHGAPDLSGSVMAVPLLFDLFNGLDPGGGENWFQEPPALFEREVCRETGQLPAPTCTHIVNDHFIRRISHQKICELDKLLYISPDSSLQYCTECLPPTGYLRAAYPIYDPELTLWFENNNRSYRRPPPHNPACEAVLNGEGPKILSPLHNHEFLVEKGAGQEVLLQAASDPKVGLQYWYLNGHFYRSCKPGERIFFVPRPGKNQVSCMDDKGRENHVEILVKEY
ncbi:MAG: penicillin-binding protein 1C [Bacteroidia bacterium]|nr:penicillin-binding protein 1C [Bacteroidia bacterium]